MTGETDTTGFAVLEVGDLPAAPIDAAATFHAEYLADARDVLEDNEAQVLVIHLPHAREDHDDWRRAIARDLARAYAPKRVNVICADDRAGRDALLDYLLHAPGVTGQYLPTDD